MKERSASRAQLREVVPQYAGGEADLRREGARAIVQCPTAG
jgi:hypothetical protein